MRISLSKVSEISVAQFVDFQKGYTLVLYRINISEQECGDLLVACSIFQAHNVQQIYCKIIRWVSTYSDERTWWHDDIITRFSLKNKSIIT